MLGIHQVSLLVVFHLLSRCRSSSYRGGGGNYGVSGSSGGGVSGLGKWKLGGKIMWKVEIRG